MQICYDGNELLHAVLERRNTSEVYHEIKFLSDLSNVCAKVCVFLRFNYIFGT